MSDYLVWYAVSTALFLGGTLVYFISMPKVVKDNSENQRSL